MAATDAHSESYLALGSVLFPLEPIVARKLTGQGIIYPGDRKNGSASYLLSPDYKIVHLPDTNLIIIEDPSGKLVTCLSFDSTKEHAGAGKYVIAIPQKSYLRFLQLANMCGIRDFYPATLPSGIANDPKFGTGDWTAVYSMLDNETLIEELYALGILSIGGYGEAEKLGYRKPDREKIDEHKLYLLTLASYVSYILDENLQTSDGRLNEELLKLLREAGEAGMNSELLQALAGKLVLS